MNMISITALAHGISYHIDQFFSELTAAVSLKLFLAFCSSLLAYTIGVNSVSIFLALVTMVVLEFIAHLVLHVHAAIKSKDWSDCWTQLELLGLGVAAQLVAYGALTSAGHLVDQIVLDGSSFLESIVISFLAVSQLIRIIKATGDLGYTVPPFLVNMLQSYTEMQTNRNKQ